MDPEWSADPLVGLVQVRQAREYLDTLEAAAVEDLRSRGVTWEVIAEALGCTRQAAWKRHGPGSAVAS